MRVNKMCQSIKEMLRYFTGEDVDLLVVLEDFEMFRNQVNLKGKCKYLSRLIGIVLLKCEAEPLPVLCCEAIQSTLSESDCRTVSAKGLWALISEYHN